MSEDRSGRHGRASRNWTVHGHGDVSSEPMNVMAPTSVVFLLSAVLHVVRSSAIRIHLFICNDRTNNADEFPSLEAEYIPLLQSENFWYIVFVDSDMQICSQTLH